MPHSLNEPHRIFNLYVGDTSAEFAKKVTAIDSSAMLVTDKNLIKVVSSYVPSAYTSINDLGEYLNFKKLLDLSANITYIPPTRLNTTDTLDISDYTKLLLENYIIDTGRKINDSDSLVAKYNAKFLRLDSRRQTSNQQIWIVGCSNAEGTHVLPEERFGSILSTTLNLPASWIAKSGTSIQWASDQIVRADIQSGDIVFWGLTSNNRKPYYDRDQLIRVTPHTYVKNKSFDQIVPMEQLDSIDILYQNVTAIQRAISRCQSANAKLFIIDTVANPLLKPFLYKIKNYDPGVAYYNTYIDFGSDGSHPGPEQHKIFAKNLLNLYNKTI